MHVESNPVDRSAKIDERVEPPVIRRLRELLEAEVGAGESLVRDKAADEASREVASRA